MSDMRRNALMDKVKRYDETKKMLAGRPDSSADHALRDQVAAKAWAFVNDYVQSMVRDGTVAPYLGLGFAEDILVLVLGRELRGRLHDLDLHELVKVVQEVPVKEDDK